MPSESLPRVAFIGTGGTIASLGVDAFDLLDYTESGKRVDSATLIARAGVDGVARIELRDFCNIDSTAMTQGDWHDLAQACIALAGDAGLSGIVIGHGTASLEETAFALSLVLDLPIPVVVTGAMRPLSGISCDGPANLAAALRVASAGRPGVFVVMNDEVHAPHRVTKSDTMRLNAFVSPGCGPLGQVDGAHVSWAAPPVRPFAPFAATLLARMPRVDLTLSHVGADGTAIRAFAAAGARGIVSAGFGPGMATPAETQALAQAVRAGVTVVQAFRGGAGHVVDSASHRRLGIISAGRLAPQKARILLGLCLARGDGPEAIARSFQAG